MNAFPTRVSAVLVLLVCTGGCLTASRPSLNPLDYLPTLEYLRNVLRLSARSLSEVTLEPKLPLAVNVSQLLSSVRSSLNDAQQAADTITEVLESQNTTLVQQLSQALQNINRSLCESDFHFPEYYRQENVSKEMNLLKLTMSEHLSRVDFQKDTLEYSDVREINAFLTGATSQAMSATTAVHIIASVEKLSYYLKVYFFPPHMETATLKELQDMNLLSRSYNQLFGATLQTASRRFLDQATQGRQLLRTVLESSSSLPESAKNATELFSNQVDDFIHKTLGDLQTTVIKGNERFGEVVQNILYTSFGLLSSGIKTVRPYLRHYQCVQNLVPQMQTHAGASLGSVALCFNEATTPLYDATMVFHERIGHLQHETFDALQGAVACNESAGNCSSVYKETEDLIRANSEAVMAFTVDLEPFRVKLHSCLTSRYEVQMAKVLDMSVHFEKCIKSFK
uniref:Protein TsetseEP domain-containing protein n=1 Tax=Anopheles epiroticus TaxID=199890 RepID=A0A182PDE5_9DIPT